MDTDTHAHQYARLVAVLGFSNLFLHLGNLAVDAVQVEAGRATAERVCFILKVGPSEAVSRVQIGELLEELPVAATATIALLLSKHNAAAETTNQYSVALTENAGSISNLVCHPAVTISAQGSVGNSVLRHLDK